MSDRARILEISAYPPPSSGWSVRVQHLKRFLEKQGHECVVLNIGTNRTVPSTDYETVLSGWDYLRKVVRFTRCGFTAHIHVNGRSQKGLVLALVAGGVGVLLRRRAFLTFHAGVNQDYFPRDKAPAWRPLFWLLFALPRTIVCNSDDVKAKIVEYGISPTKIVPIPAFSRQYLEGERPALPAELESFYQRFSRVLFSYLRIRPEYYPLELVRGFATVAATRPDVGLVLCGVSGHSEAGLLTRTRSEIDELGLQDRVYFVADLDHDTFLVALSRAAVYVRTPDTDGVASSVLEALGLGVPVVAADNGSRPPGVITYSINVPGQLTETVARVLDRRSEVVVSLPRARVDDTLAAEVRLLTGTPAAQLAS